MTNQIKTKQILETANCFIVSFCHCFFELFKINCDCNLTGRFPTKHDYHVSKVGKKINSYIYVIKLNHAVDV